MLRRRHLFKNVTRSQSYARIAVPPPQPTYLDTKSQILLRLNHLESLFKAQLRIRRFQYIYLSEAYPHTSAAISAATILLGADVAAQSITSHEPWDVKRSVAMATFGFLYYGFPCKYIFFMYERLWGAKMILTKTFVDCFLHAPLGVIPAFYAITGTIRGDSLSKTVDKLKSEWLSVSFGTIVFWIPAQLVCFRFVPMHSRVVWICTCSFFHKTWLSWYTNRQQQKMTHNPRRITLPVGMNLRTGL